MLRKRLSAVLLIVALLFAPVSAQANTVDCTNCGRALNPSICTYCPYCGVRVNNYLQITDAYQKRNGQVYVAWRDEGSHGPYTVKYRRYVNENYLASAQQKELLWYEEESQNTYRTNVSLSYLSPGYDYWIEVWDSRNVVCRYHYSAPEVYAFKDFSSFLSVQCRKKNGSGYTNQSTFSASSLASDPSSYGLYLWLEFPALSRTASYCLTIVVVDPTGSPIANSSWDSITLESGWISYGWDFYQLDWYFSQVKGQHGSIRTGQYTVSCYLNGQLAGSGNFTVQ